MSISVKEILVREENYADEMKNKVLPYINERREVLCAGRSPGETLYCLHYSPENPRAAVVISHGFTETTAKYAEMVYYFLNADYAVYVYDHCGHGLSYRLTGDPAKVHIDSYKRYVNDLLFIAHTAKNTYPDLPLYLFGHSMGGGIAASAGALEPSLFARIVLSAPMIRPATGNFPWPLTRIICRVFVCIGKGKDYAPGQHPYDGKDNFEGSASTSKARYDYYNAIRKADEKLQMNGATYGWLFAGVQMNTYLQTKGWKRITAPVLVFQAENEEFVINSQQDLFVKKLKKRTSAELVHVPGTKHEIYRSDDATMEAYLQKIFNFYENA